MSSSPPMRTTSERPMSDRPQTRVRLRSHEAGDAVQPPLRMRDLPSILCRSVKLLVGATMQTSLRAASRGYRQFEIFMIDDKRATYGLAVARIALGVMIIGSTLTNFSTRAYSRGAGMAWSGEVHAPRSEFLDIFPIGALAALNFEPGSQTVFWIAHLVLAALWTVGYRARLLTIPLLVSWVAFVETNANLADQSENLVRISLIALFFTASSARWSLDAWRARRGRATGNPLVRLWRCQPVLPAWVGTIAHNCAIVVLAAQICMVYAAGGLFKAAGEPWKGGWAVYNPIQTMRFGPYPELSDLISAWGPLVAAATVGTVLVQVGFPLLLLRRGTRLFALAVIFAFHVAIGIVMGLPWFSLSMLALDAILIRDRSWRLMTVRCVQIWRRARAVDNGTAPGEWQQDEGQPDARDVAGARERMPAGAL